MSTPDFRVRLATVDDLGALRSALAWAIDWRSPEPASDPEDVIEKTGHAYLLEAWGRAGDAAVVAETAQGPVGAAWRRYWRDDHHSYGYVDSDCPELGIGVDPRLRGSGIGTALLAALIDQATGLGIGRLSLSVEGDNPALRLYERFGFVRHIAVDSSWTMIRILRSQEVIQ